MSKQQVKGNGATMSVPTADRARNVLQNVENLYNLELVTRVFEDASIPDSKLESGGGGGAFAYTDDPMPSLYGENTDIPYAVKHGIQIGIGAKSWGGNFSPYYGIAIGYQSTGTQRGVAIGYKANADRGEGVSTSNGVAIGSYATVDRDGVAIGGYAYGWGNASIAIGDEATSYSANSISIGKGSTVEETALSSVAIGPFTDVFNTHTKTVVIGYNVQSTAANQVKIGVSNTDTITFDTWSATVDAAAPSTHKIPVLVGGVRYNLLATTA